MKKKSCESSIALKVCAVISLLSTFLSFIGYFFIYVYKYNGGKEYYYLQFSAPNFGEIVAMLITVAPCIILLIYALKLQNSPKGNILIAAIIGLLFIGMVYNLLFEVYIVMRWLLYMLVVFIISLWVLISVCKGNYSKAAIVTYSTSLIVFMTLDCVNVFARIGYFFPNQKLYAVDIIFSWLGTAALCVALIAILIKKRKITSDKPKKQKLTYISDSPEGELQSLKVAFEEGKITEEEYNEKRKEVIDKI